MNNDDGDFFEKSGLEVKSGEVVVGETYPIYGMITKFIDETPGNVVVEVNYNIQLVMLLDSAEKIQLLKERAFDPGIFVTTISQVESGIKGDCTTVVFGKRSTEQMQ